MSSWHTFEDELRSPLCHVAMEEMFKYMSSHPSCGFERASEREGIHQRYSCFVWRRCKGLVVSFYFALAHRNSFCWSCIAPEPKEVLDVYSTISASQPRIFNAIFSKKKSNFYICWRKTSKGGSSAFNFSFPSTSRDLSLFCPRGSPLTE